MNKTLKKAHKIIFLSVISFAAVIYVLSVNYYYIGTYNDDAWYVNAAKYIAGVQGAHQELSERPLGYSFLLSPFVKLFPENEYVLRFPSIVLTLFVPIILFFWLRDAFPANRLIIYLVLLCFNAYSIMYSVSVMSEAAFVFLTFASIVLLKKNIENHGRFLSVAVLSFLCVMMFFFKSQGILFFMSVFIYYLMRRQYRTSAVLIILYACILFIVKYSIFAEYGLGPFRKYSYEVIRRYSNPAVLEMFYKNAFYYISWGISSILLNIRGAGYSSAVLVKVAVFFISIVSFSVTIFGMIEENRCEYLKPVKIYMVLYFLQNILWVNVSIRYLVPIMPFILYYFLTGVYYLRKQLFYIVSLILLVLYASYDVSIVRASLKEHPGNYSRPIQTFEWIRHNTEESDVFATLKPSLFSYNTGRRTELINCNQSRDELYHSLVSKNVSHVAIFSARTSQRTFGDTWSVDKYSLLKFIMNDKNRFENIYENINEETILWKVKSSTAFIKAWSVNTQGFNSYNNGDITKATAYFEEAVSLYSDFPMAVFNLAQIYIGSKRYREAMDVLNSALRQFPNSKILLVLKGEVFRSNGDVGRAVWEWKKAQKIAQILNQRNSYTEIGKIVSEAENSLKNKKQVRQDQEEKY
ncbi:tetratricopeptide repeat protein [Elusimicrobiota bacterium]